MTPIPGAGRLTVTVLAIVTAVLAYPWQTAADRWVLSAAVAVALVALARWRGNYLTTILGRRIRVWLGRNTIQGSPADLHHAGLDVVTTVLVQASSPDSQLPIGLFSSYLDRYGLRSDSVRITTRSTPDETTTWIGLTFRAAENLAALQARSTQIPLRQTAENAARRMVSQLQEIGWTATLVDSGQLPELVAGETREHWQSVSDARGHLSAYAVETPETALATVSAAVADESWAVVELAGTPAQVQIRAAAAIRTEAPPASAPLPGLVPLPGRQAEALMALHPFSVARLVN